MNSKQRAIYDKLSRVSLLNKLLKEYGDIPASEIVGPNVGDNVDGVIITQKVIDEMSGFAFVDEAKGLDNFVVDTIDLDSIRNIDHGIDFVKVYTNQGVKTITHKQYTRLKQRIEDHNWNNNNE